jgi:hypothetical protein
VKPRALFLISKEKPSRQTEDDGNTSDCAVSQVSITEPPELDASKQVVSNRKSNAELESKKERMVAAYNNYKASDQAFIKNTPLLNRLFL